MCGFDYFGWGSSLLASGLVFLAARVFIDVFGKEKGLGEQVSRNILISAILIFGIALLMMLISAMPLSC